MTTRVRELPPLRHTFEIETPDGKHYRWADDAPNSRDVPSGVSGSSTMPGGFEQFTGSLPRRPGTDYADLERLSTITERSATGDIVGEYRLERTPRTSGDQMLISPAAVGWQAHLADDQTAQLIVIDRDLNRWQGPSRSRLLVLIGAGYNAQGPTVRPDTTSGVPSLELGFDESGAWSSSSKPDVEAWYDAGDGNQVGRLMADWNKGSPISAADTTWNWQAYLESADDAAVGDTTGSLRAVGPGTVDLSSTDNRRFALLAFAYNGVGGSDQSNLRLAISFTNVRVIGTHGLALHGADASEDGFLASDIVAYVVRRWAPLLNFTTGPLGTIQPSTFVIPQLAWTDRTDGGEMVRQSSRFGLEDWAVWEGKTFYWNGRGDRVRNWIARVTPAQLEETGPQIDRLWSSVVVQYRDVDGSSRSVGPPGSGVGTESSDLNDPDPDNPANQLGFPRRALLQAGTLPASAAIQLGRRFLAEQKTLDSSGRAQLIGHVMDDHGVLWPYSHVRAGDTVTFVDAADKSPRRIVRAGHDHSARATTVDLDSPPEGLSALLERLGVTLQPLGV